MDGEESTALATADQAREMRDEARGRGNHTLAQQYDAQERAILAREVGEVAPTEEGDDLPDGWATSGLYPDELRGARQLAHELMAADPAVGDVLDNAMILRDGYPVPLGDHPAVLGALARLAKALQRKAPAPAPVAAAAVRMSANPEAQLDDLRDRRNAALAKGRRSEALRLDAEERQLLAATFGNGPIVGNSNRTA